MPELVAAIVEVDTHSLKLCLKICHLLLEGVNFTLGLSSMPDLEGIDFLSEHEHSVLCHVLG